jgi:hypothetical protein
MIKRKWKKKEKKERGMRLSGQQVLTAAGKL